MIHKCQSKYFLPIDICPIYVNIIYCDSAWPGGLISVGGNTPLQEAYYGIFGAALFCPNGKGATAVPTQVFEALGVRLQLYISTRKK